MPTAKEVLDSAKTGLVAKLSEVMGLMQSIPKEGWNDNQKYRFVRETDVAERVSQLLAERHVFITQTVRDWSINEHFRTSSGSMMWLSIVTMDFTFIDGDTGETLGPVTFVGHGADTGDKGIYKAMTGAEKYFLMKTFLISTGDDPEADTKVDKAAAAAAAASGPPKVTASAQPGVKRGGKSDVATVAQVNEVIRHLKRLEVSSAAETIVLLRTIAPIETPKEGQAIAIWLANMSGDTIAKLIDGLSDIESTKVTEDVEEDDAEPPTDGLVLE